MISQTPSWEVAIAIPIGHIFWLALIQEHLSKPVLALTMVYMFIAPSDIQLYFSICLTDGYLILLVM